MSTLKTYLHERTVLWEIMKTEKTDDVIGWYDKNSELYEKYVPNAGFRYHGDLAETVVEYVSNKRAVILDLGAGSGIIGKLLFDRGFLTIDALDASQKMLDIAIRKRVYRNTLLATIGTEKIKGLTEGSYDAVVAGGVFSVGTVQYNSIPMLMNYVKKGGYIIFNVAEESMSEIQALSARQFQILSSQWEEAKLCRCVEERESYHINDEPAKIIVLQKM
ncbi:uncharacterized protein [Apostichopus japonicus]|uniref:uncharacterized protein isoform X1 n=1 Tax=Stichopus japonicus TaxID=307972 RepID=UPI003AB3CC29